MHQPNNTITRRQLLKRTATLSALGVLAPWQLARGQEERSPSETIHIAAIGTGNMGRVNIRSATRAGAKIVALCDVDEAQAMPLAEEYPKAAHYTDFRRLLDTEKGIDAVMISTPDHTHAPIAMAAMQLGKHVYCEKPLAHTLYEVRVLTEAARQQKVATQLGNQGHSFFSIREFAECIWSGAIGEVREVHAVQAAFSNSRIGQLVRVDDNHALPKTLDWDLWLGPAPYRKYNPMYHPGAWRGWRPFGTGSIGDFLCHIVDPIFWALDLGAPTSVVAEAESYDPDQHRDTFPRSSKIRFFFPARGPRPPVTLYWYDGDQYRPPNPEDEAIPVPGWEGGPSIGALVVGDKAKIVYGSHGAKEWHIYPESKMKEYMGDRERVPEPAAMGPPGNLKHIQEWLQACKGWKTAGSNFDYGGPLTELAMLGNIASLMPGTELEWDSEHLTFPNHPVANQYLHFAYREGWTL